MDQWWHKSWTSHKSILTQHYCKIVLHNKTYITWQQSTHFQSNSLGQCSKHTIFPQVLSKHVQYKHNVPIHVLAYTFCNDSYMPFSICQGLKHVMSFQEKRNCHFKVVLALLDNKSHSIYSCKTSWLWQTNIISRYMYLLIRFAVTLLCQGLIHYISFQK